MRHVALLALLAACGSSKHATSAAEADLALHGGTGDLAGFDGGSSITRSDVYITWYGFNDNSCTSPTQTNCDDIAYPMNAGWPTPHDVATEGKGTYDDPNTFATAANNDGTDPEIAIGAIIYVPSVRKYFVMEDLCGECVTDWQSGSWHTDLWMGPQYGSNPVALSTCEDKLSIGSEGHGTGTIVIAPLPDLPVDTTPLFSNDTCTAHQY